MAESRNFLGETPDQRRNRRKDELIDAALTLVHTGGLPALGVRSLTTEAGLSSRYFYESFASIDDLLIAALHQISANLIHVGVARIHAAPLPDPATAPESEILDRLRQGLDAALGVIVDDDPRKAGLIAAIGAGGPRVREELQKLVYVVAAAITNDASAADLGFDHASALFVAGGQVQLTIAYVSGELDISRTELVDRLARLTLGAISATTSERTG